MPMKTVRTEIEYLEKSSRLELFIRVIYALVLQIIANFLGAAILSVLTLIHAIHILVFGRRHPTLQKLIQAIIFYGSRANYYTYLLTDERPPLIPEL